MPSDSSLITKISKLSVPMISFFIGQKFISSLNIGAGRRFMERFRNALMARIEFFSQSFHFVSNCAFTGPPTDPKSIASDVLQRSFVSFGKWLLCFPHAAPPMSPCVILHLNPNSSSHFFSIFIASLQTSSPMPSPGRSPML